MELNKVKILDCTLRDGGYYTNWDFSKRLTRTYFSAMNDLPVEYLEIGYRSVPLKEYLGEYFYCPLYVIEEARRLSTKKLVIILNEKDIKPEHADNLLRPCVGLIDLVRIAVDPQNFSRALKLAEAIKKLGFEVGFNVMYMSTWKRHKAFLEEIRMVGGIADYFYLVDSFGGVYPEDVRESIALVKERTFVKIGFHGHNNLELALINSITAVEQGASIIDSTITGMGRGAGNLKTELLLTALNARAGLEVNFNSLSNVVDAFEQLQKEFGWGTNFPYMISGANSLPQKDVMEWVTKRFYSFNSIIRALQNQKDGVEDNQKLPVFKPAKKYSKVVIIGGGPNAAEHATAAIEFVKIHSDICIIHASSKNAKLYNSLNVDQFFCLVGNEGHRLEKVFEDLGQFKGQCILPPYPRKMGTYIPQSIVKDSFELERITFTPRLHDSHTVIAIQTAIALGAKEIFFIGYDGYSGDRIDQREQELFQENESIFKDASSGEVKLFALTPTKYKSLIIHSVYSYF